MFLWVQAVTDGGDLFLLLFTEYFASFQTLDVIICHYNVNKTQQQNFKNSYTYLQDFKIHRDVFVL